MRFLTFLDETDKYDVDKEIQNLVSAKVPRRAGAYKTLYRYLEELVTEGTIGSTIFYSIDFEAYCSTKGQETIPCEIGMKKNNDKNMVKEEKESKRR